MEGPQFSTKAESLLYRQWGCSVIGMTNMPEAKLAREAELCYATVAMVTDFDCWHPDHDAVTVEQVVKVLFSNADKARALVADLVPRSAPRAAHAPPAATARSTTPSSPPRDAGPRGGREARRRRAPRPVTAGRGLPPLQQLLRQRREPARPIGRISSLKS
jgi:hypothetical protein